MTQKYLQSIFRISALLKNSIMKILIQGTFYYLVMLLASSVAPSFITAIFMKEAKQYCWNLCDITAVFPQSPPETSFSFSKSPSYHSPMSPTSLLPDFSSTITFIHFTIVTLTFASTGTFPIIAFVLDFSSSCEVLPLGFHMVCSFGSFLHFCYISVYTFKIFNPPPTVSITFF